MEDDIQGALKKVNELTGKYDPFCLKNSLRSWRDSGAGERAVEPPYSLAKPAREFTSGEAASEFRTFRMVFACRPLLSLLIIQLDKPIRDRSLN